MRVLSNFRNVLHAFLLLPVLAACVGIAAANPNGGSVTTGSATIQSSGSTLNIDQSTSKVSIDWNSFSIGSGQTVNFLQPGASSIALNRVVGNDPSSIYGSLNANGQVFLINPRGVLFGKGSSVNVGGLAASTLNLTDSDFLAGRYRFAGSGGLVINDGDITAADGGYAVLLGAQANNNGVVVAKYGTVALAGGNAVTLDLAGDGLLNIVVNQSALAASVANNGVIKAAGGQIYLTAHAANALAGTVVNNTGIIEAEGVSDNNGTIVLDGGSAGTVANSGTLDASGKSVGSTGGVVKVLGQNVSLGAGSDIDVSGDSGGGTALIGGASHGGQSEPAADDTSVASGGVIDASAVSSGDGGQVVVWSNGEMSFNGTITAEGGAAGGNGGSVEVSGKCLNFDGLVDTLAPNGVTGSLLLDPEDYTIDSSNVGILESDLSTTSETIATDGSGDPDIGGTPGLGDIDVNAPLTWSSSSTLTLNAANNININSPITAQSGGLTLNAVQTIAAPAAVDVNEFVLDGGNWVQNAESTGPGLLPAFTANDFTLSGGTFLRVDGGDGQSTSTPYLIGDVYGLQGMGGFLGSDFELDDEIYAAGTSGWNGGAGFIPIGNAAAPFTGSFYGQYYSVENLSETSSAAQLGLFGDSTGTISSVYLYGGSVIGTGSASVGALVGQNGGTVSNGDSTVDVSDTGTSTAAGNAGGLIGENDGTVTGGYTDANVTSGGPGTSGAIGGLIGYNSGTGTVSSSNAVGTVTVSESSSNAGGLVGLNAGTLTGVFATGTIDDYGSTGNNVGGLVGSNSSDIDNSYATGYVNEYAATGGALGGLVGLNTGTIAGQSNVQHETGSYSSAAVSDYVGGNDVGGLVGTNEGTIEQSFATGSVVNSGSLGDDNLGGLVGLNSAGEVSESYASAAVTDEAGSGTNLGGLVGSNNATVADTYAIGNVAVNGPSGDSAGGLVGTNGGSVANSYASGQVTGSGSIGGVAGANSGTLTDTYWDTVTGPAAGVGSGTTTGAAGLNEGTAAGTNVFDDASYIGFDIATDNDDLGHTWLQIENQTRPMLTFEFATGVLDPIDSPTVSTITTPHQLQLAALFPDYNYYLGTYVSLSAISNASDVWRQSSEPGPDGYGFSSINGLTGSFQGNGYTIDSLSGTGGLFGSIQDSGYVNGVSLTNVNVTAVSGQSSVGALANSNDGQITSSFAAGSIGESGSGDNSIGGLVGDNTGTITNSSANVNIVNSSSGQDDIGGLVGLNDGTIQGENYGGDNNNCYALGSITDNVGGGDDGGLVGDNEASITNSYAYGTVTVSDSGEGNDSVGGLVGSNSTGAVSTSYASVAVSDTNPGGSSQLGGLVGYNDGSISNTYAIGSVSSTGNSGTASIGGLVGTDDTEGSVSNGYATGVLTSAAAETTLGGLIGINNGSVTDGYYDVTSTAAAQAIGSDTTDTSTTFTLNEGAGASSGTDPFYANSYGTFDFGSTWYMIDGLTRPFLQMEYGTYPINSHMLQLMQMDLGADYFQLANITMPELTNSGMWQIPGNADDSLSYGFVPVGSGADPFGGYFNGDGNSISGLIVSSTGDAGLFADNTGEIYDVDSTAETIDGEGTNTGIGGVVGNNLANGTLDYNFESGSISDVSSGGSNSVGGIAGTNAGTMYGDDMNSGSVADDTTGGAGDSIGGLVGSNTGTISDYSTSSATVIDASSGGGETDNVGGLIGYNNGTFGYGMSASGNVYDESTGGSENDSLGGLIGYNNSTMSNSASASGNVSDESSAGGEHDALGGLIGNNAGTVSAGTASGSVSDDSSGGGEQDNIGGFVGYNTASISNIDQSSDPTIEDAAGGSEHDNLGALVGSNSGNITNSMYSGSGSILDVSELAIDSGASPSIDGKPSSAFANGPESDLLGGLVGYNNGLLSGDTSNAYVEDRSDIGGETDSLGGLVGENDVMGTITGSSADGEVADGAFHGGETDYIGGLVGVNYGSISAGSYSSGDVYDEADNQEGGEVDSVGGLVGYNGGSLSDIDISGFAEDNSGDDPEQDNVGVLVGTNAGAITGCASSGETYDESYYGGQQDNIGGLVGLNTANGVITDSSSTAAASDYSYGHGEKDNIGGLVGNNFGSIVGGYASGQVGDESYSESANDNLGGLVGINSGSISEGSSSSNVTYASRVSLLAGKALSAPDESIASDNLGGLVGLNTVDGSITGSEASGDVTDSFHQNFGLFTEAVLPSPDSASNNLGGLVGENDGSITGFDYSSATVTDIAYRGGETDDLGGLVGYNSPTGTIDEAFATGNVADDSTGGSQADWLGGLVGENAGSVSVTFANGNVTDSSMGGGQADELGGSIGENNGSVSNSYATGTVSDQALSSGGDDIGGLVGVNDGGTVDTSYAVGAVGGGAADTVGGLVGQNAAVSTPADSAPAGSITDSFWDTTTSGTTTGIDSDQNSGDTVYGLTDAAMMQSGSYTPDWDFVNTWKAYNGNTYPLLTAFLTPLDITVGGAAVTYDGSAQTPTFNYPEEYNNNLVFGSVNYTEAGQSPTTGPVNAGSYAIGGLYSTQLGYDIEYSNPFLTIDPLALTYTVANASSTYGTLATPGSYQLSGVLAQDAANVGGVENITDSQNNPVDLAYNTNAGTYTESISGLTGSGASNYTIAQTGNTNGLLTIDPKALTYTIASEQETYGSSFTLGGVTLNGVVAGDTIIGSDGLSNVSSSNYTASGNLSAGQYTEGFQGFEGSDPSNYTLAANGNTNGVLTVDPKTLTYSIANAGSTYGTLATLGQVDLNGIVAGDQSAVNGAEVATGANGAPVTLAYNTSAGQYGETITGLIGSDANNYVVASSGNTNGVLTIDPKTLTYSIVSGNSTYGTLATPGALTLNGVVAGDSGGIGGMETVTTTGGQSVTLAVNTDAGTYDETLTGLTGSLIGDYTLAPAGNHPGVLTVDPAQLTVAANNANRYVSKPNPPFTAVVSGLTGGDTLNSLGTLQFSTTAITTSAIGNYPIIPFGLSDPNYIIHYIDGTLSVNPPIGPAYFGAVATADIDVSGYLFNQTNWAIFNPDLYGLGLLGRPGYWPLTIIGDGVNPGNYTSTTD